jgi:23S rRNA (uracil1939-C5)-methyltransferase
MSELESPIVGQKLTISRIVPGGAGLAQLADGRAAFVSGAFAGDEVRIEAAQDKKTFVNVTKFHLQQASPQRVASRCPVLDACGGCDLLRLSAAGQNSAKQAIVEQALSRTGRFSLSELSEPVRVTPSPAEFGYRSRVRLQVDNGRVGFFSRGSNELVEVTSCAVAHPAVWEAVVLVREAVRQNPRAFDPVQHVEVRALGGATELHTSAVSAHFSMKDAVKAHRKAARKQLKPPQSLRTAVEPLRQVMLVRLGGELSAFQSYSPIADVKVYSAPGGFTQVNESVNRFIVEKVVALAQTAGSRTFLDLYCGSGNFAIPLLAAGLHGVGVELNDEAIAGAERAAQEQSLAGRFLSAPSANYLSGVVAKGEHFDMVVVDPPRAGAKEILQSLLGLKSPLLVMVSCDPVTLARDLRVLVDGGYRLRSVEAWDMFPQTHHVETMAVLQAVESSRHSPEQSYVPPHG